MGHTTFYRKYRSRNFEELLGQPQVVQTLSNAITHDRLAHAYIFSGPRGTGKTSSARILAQALNCEKGSSLRPCLSCALCQRIVSGQCVDVMEIDAASHTGVDHMRDLNEQVTYTPVECRYKIYIIDEAHMLSTGAFNALLKTLEEPPAFTMFILATTELHKIPATIQSRCQVLYFRQLSPGAVGQQLRQIAQAEGIQLSDAAIMTIARQAGGCMRDAVSLLDQVYSYKGTQIDAEDVLFVLGATDFNSVFSLSMALLESRASEALSTLSTVLASGVSPIQLLQQLNVFFRDLVFLKLGLAHLVAIEEGRRSAVEAAIGTASPDRIQALFDALTQLESGLRWAPQPELFLQVKFVMAMAQGQGQPPGLSAAASVKPASAPAASPKMPSAKTSPVPAAPPVSFVAVSEPSSSPEPALSAAPIVNAAPTDGPAALWRSILSKIKSQKPSLYSFLHDSECLKTGDRQIQIRLLNHVQFFVEKLNEPANRKLIESVVSEIAGRPLTLDVLPAFSEAEATPVESEMLPLVGVFPPSSSPVSSAAPAKSTRASAASSGTDSRRLNDIIQLFDGSLV